MSKKEHKNLDNLTAYEVADMILTYQLDMAQSETLIEEYAMQKMKGISKQQKPMKEVKFEGLIHYRNKLWS